jgi:hypothetical protein
VFGRPSAFALMHRNTAELHASFNINDKRNLFYV